MIWDDMQHAFEKWPENTGATDSGKKHTASPADVGIEWTGIFFCFKEDGGRGVLPVFFYLPVPWRADAFPAPLLEPQPLPVPHLE